MPWINKSRKFRTRNAASCSKMPLNALHMLYCAIKLHPKRLKTTVHEWGAHQNLKLTPHFWSLFTFKAFMTPCNKPGWYYWPWGPAQQVPRQSHCPMLPVPVLCASFPKARSHRKPLGWAFCLEGFGAPLLVWSLVRNSSTAWFCRPERAYDHLHDFKTRVQRGEHIYFWYNTVFRSTPSACLNRRKRSGAHPAISEATAATSFTTAALVWGSSSILTTANSI